MAVETESLEERLEEKLMRLQVENGWLRLELASRTRSLESQRDRCRELLSQETEHMAAIRALREENERAQDRIKALEAALTAANTKLSKLEGGAEIEGEAETPPLWLQSGFNKEPFQKAIGGDKSALWEAFMWMNTREGDAFWGSQATDSIDQEAFERLKEMAEEARKFGYL